MAWLMFKVLMHSGDLGHFANWVSRMNKARGSREIRNEQCTCTPGSQTAVLPSP